MSRSLTTSTWQTKNFMHPTIEKFWTQKYKIFLRNEETHQDWFIMNNGHKPTKIAVFQIHRISTDLEYMYNNDWYTEEDMLRIVNLTAFM